MRRGRILILLGLILAIGTAVAVFVVIRSMQPEPVVPDLEEVVVAVQPIAEEESVRGRIDLRPVPSDYIPEGALRTLEGTEEMLAAGPIPQGTILHPDMLLTPMELLQEGQLGRLVEPGKLAVAFPISELSSVSYGIQPGDHVDVLMTLFFVDMDQQTQTKEPLCPPLCPGAEGQTMAEVSDQRPRLATQLTLQDVKVLGVGRWVQEEVPAEEADNQARTGEQVPVELPKYITVEMTPQDALVLKLAREQGASIDLAVRAQDDDQVFATQQVTLDYLLARFGISLPTRQPYSIDSASTAGSDQ
jgi:pilus assembly protein CpaB